MTSSPETPRETEARVPPSAAAVLAFVVLALVNVVYIAVGARSKGAVRLLHHLVDAGHLLFLGALAALALLSWARLCERSAWLASRRFAAEALLAVLGVGAAYAFAREDFAGFASEAGGESGGPALLGALLLVVGLSPALTAVVAARLARLDRFVAVCLGVVGAMVAVANGLVLTADYPGIHLFLAFDAVVLLTVALANAPLPKRLASLAGTPVARFAPALLCLVTLPSVLVPPNNAVRTQLSRIDTAILVPVLASHVWTTGDRPELTGVPEELRAWVVERKDDKPIPPSGASLLPDKPIVILIGIDSLRADLFTTEDGRTSLPNLLALEKRALSFEMARSPGARTITSWSQIFLGRYVTGLRWKGDGNRLGIADERKRFSDYLHDQGVRTTTYVSYSALGKGGLTRGFDEIVEVRGREGQSFALSDQVVPKLIESLEKNADGPRFYFTHFMDPHFPYDAVPTKGSPRKKFLAEIALADASVGKLWEALEKNGLLDRTVLVVTADHGEGLGEHDAKYHTVNLYEELIRVPLFVVIPGVKPRKIATPVTLMDLGPTFLDLFSIKTPASFLGESLLPFARGKDPVLTRPIGAERSGTRAMIFGDRKLIVDKSKGRQEVYDLAKDPDEARNLADENDPEDQKRFAVMQRFFDIHSIPQ